MIAKVLGETRNPRIKRASIVAVLVLLLIPVSAFSADQDSIAALRQMGKAFASIADKASPAVVGIQATKVVENASARNWQFEDPSQEDLFRYFFGPRRSPRQRQPREQRQVAQGSGFIISPDGYILTNNHMVGGAETVTVQLADGTKISAEVIGADAQTDVALVKIDKEDLPYIEMADSDNVEVGEWVIAIGNPFTLSHTVTAGIVSATGRSRIGVADYEDFIQTDAAINMGNSGGPLLNLDGKAVGINTAIIGPGANVGIGLAIPSNMAVDIYTRLKESGEVVRGFLGIEMNEIKPGMGEFYKLDNDDGVIVMNVMPDSPAEKAGLEKDDVIVEFEDEAVTTMNDFRNRVAMYKPDSKVELVVIRDGRRKKLTAVLTERPGNETLAGRSSRDDLQESLGMSLETLTDEWASQLEYEGLSGVVVTEVRAGSLAYEAGIREGTLITEVNRKSIDNVKDFMKAVEAAKDDGKPSVLLRIRYRTVSQLVLLRLSDK